MVRFCRARLGAEDWELIYWRKLFLSAVFVDSPTLSGDSGIRA